MFESDDDFARRRQLRKAHQLLELLKEGAKKRLPPLVWSVAGIGALHGQATQSDPEQQRTAFDAWCAHLGAKKWPERRDEYAGYLRLMGAVTPPDSDLPDYVITADIFLNLEEEDQTP